MRLLIAEDKKSLSRALASRYSGADKTPDFPDQEPDYTLPDGRGTHPAADDRFPILGCGRRNREVFPGSRPHTEQDF